MGSGDFPVTYNGSGYDIKRFLRDHPGGVNTLEKYKDKSVMEAMKLFGHSKSAYHMLGDFKVADIRDSNLTGNVSENGRIITKEEADRDVDEIALLEKLESRLDWSKPMLGQLEAIAPHYDMWVNSAVYRQCRLFSSPLLESMTKTLWYLVPMFWIPIIVFLGVTQWYKYVACGESCSENSLSFLKYVQHIIMGILIWSALEYSLHRWLFHFSPGSSLMMMRLHFLIHGLHHKVPFDVYRQVFPPIPAALISASLYSILRMFVIYPDIKFTGALIGYLAYDMIHYYVHHGAPKDGTYLYEMKRYHSNHHFINHHKAYGISTKMWDHLFKTIVHVKKLNFSLRW